MKYIIVVYHYLTFLLKLIVLIILLPFFLLYIFIKGKIYRMNMQRELKKCGLDKSAIRELKKESLKISDIIKMARHTNKKTSFKSE